MFGRLQGHSSHRSWAAAAGMQIKAAAHCLVSAAGGSCSCDEGERRLGAGLLGEDVGSDRRAAGAGGEIGGGGLRRRDGGGRPQATERRGVAEQRGRREAGGGMAGGRQRNGRPADREVVSMTVGALVGRPDGTVGAL